MTLQIVYTTMWSMMLCVVGLVPSGDLWAVTAFLRRHPGAPRPRNDARSPAHSRHTGCQGLA